MKAVAERQHRAAAAGPGVRHADRRRGRRPLLLVREVRRSRSSRPRSPPGADPSANAARSPANRNEEFAVATFNVENLYDFRDDPFDGCDFAGNTGCPGVSPPFDYVPASAEAYQARLAPEAAGHHRADALARHHPDPGGRGPGHLHGHRRRAGLRRRRTTPTASRTRCRSSRSPSRPPAARPTTRRTTATAPTTAASSPAFLYRTDRVTPGTGRHRRAVGDAGRRLPGARAGLQRRRAEPEVAQRRPSRPMWTPRPASTAPTSTPGRRRWRSSSSPPHPARPRR